MKWFHALSLDVVIGALAVGLFAVHVLKISPPSCWWSIIATAVWSVYTADHLLDGADKKGDSRMFRHQLHYKKRYLFLLFLVLSGLYALVCSLLCFDSRVINGGLILGSFVLVYLAFVFFARKYHFYFHKELFVSAVYLLGIWFAPLIWYGAIPDIAILVILIIFFLLGWADGLIIASLDLQNDRLDHQQSFVTFYGKLKTKRFIIFILAISGLLSLGGIFFHHAPGIRSAFALLLFMDIILSQLYFAPVKFAKTSLYRFLLEAIFWLPAGIIFFT